jgi:hypothetical protein
MVINHRGWASRPVRGFMGDADALLGHYIIWRYSQRRDELLYELQRLLVYAIAYQEQGRDAATRLVRHIRRCWQHAIFERHEAGKAEFDQATAEFLRLNGAVLGKKAGEAWLKDQGSRITGKKGGQKKAANQAQEIEPWHAKIQKRAKTLKGSHYGKSEALDVLEREFPRYSRRQLANIVSSVYPKKQSRAKSGG